MIKECKVILANNENIVVKYDEELIQLTNTLKINSKIVYIKYDLGKHTLSSKAEYDEFIEKSTKKNIKKTIEKEVISYDDEQND